MEEDMVKLAEIVRLNIIELRRQRGMSQADLCRASGITTAALSLIERAERAAHIDTIQALARGLGIPPDAMLRPLTAAERGELAELPPPLPPDEHSLLTHYRIISADEQRRVRYLAAGFAGTADQVEAAVPAPPAAPPPLPEDEQELLERWRQLSGERKGRVLAYLDGMLEAAKE